MRPVIIFLIFCSSAIAQITIADHNKGSSGTNTGTGVTGTMSCASANEMLAFVFDLTTDPTVATVTNSSSGGGTWTSYASQISNANTGWNVAIWAKTGTFGGTETVSASNSTGGFTAVFAMCITSGGVFDLAQGAQYNGGVNLTPGSITPSVNGEICVSGAGAIASSNNWGGPSGSTRLDTITSLADAATVQTTATAYNPVWDPSAFTGVGAGAGLNACFKPFVASTNVTPAHGTIL